MKNMRLLSVATLSGGLSLLLTGCLPTPPVPVMQNSLNFVYPDLPQNETFSLSAIYYDEKSAPHVVSTQFAGQNQSHLWLNQFDLDKLAADPKCTTPFLGGETANAQEVKVTPSTVKTCNLYFVLHRSPAQYRPADWVPSEQDVVYQTHSILSYASENFNYSLRNKAGNSTETGTRRQGWSLVRHEVMQPSATPGQYQVTMNSVAKEEESQPIRLHEKTPYFTSMSLTGGQP